MPTLNDVSLDDGLYVMLKGEPGTRKSTQALSFPLPQYWFSVDRKMKALVLPMKEWGIDPTQVHYDDYKDEASIQNKLIDLEVKCPYKTIILDSITSIGDVTNLQTIRNKSGTSRKDGSDKGNKVGGIDVNSFEDYKAENQAFTRIIDTTKSIQSYWKCNIVLIAHIIGERKVGENGLTAHARTIVTGGKAISAKIPAYCEETYHFDIEQSANADRPGKFRIITVHTGEDFARTSLPLPAKIEIGDRPLYSTYIQPAINELKLRKGVK